VVDAIAGRVWPLRRLRFEVDGASCSAALGPSSRTGLGIPRTVLDEALLEAAGAAGVEVVTGCRVIGLMPGPRGFGGMADAEGRKFEGRVLVAADGMGSSLRRMAGLSASPQRRRRYGVSAHFQTSRDPGDAITVHFRKSHEVYVTPVGDRETNVAVPLDGTEARSLGGDLTSAFLGYVSGLPEVEDASLADAPRVAGPFPAEPGAAWRHNLVLAGDAAGFHDAVTGEGISLALRASRLVASAVESYLETGNSSAFQHYDRGWRDLRRPSTLLADFILFLRRRPALARRAIRNLAARPGVFSRLVALNGGELGFRELRPRDLAGLLFGL
jgi:2-polyprenyl-6-methoxyphenol hydroxylase-like FAD-dependent oxidoreductase